MARRFRVAQPRCGPSSSTATTRRLYPRGAVWIPLVLATLGVGVRTTVLEAQSALTTATIAARATPATVTIVTLDGMGDTLAQGSGFILHGSGLLVTNWHVMAGASRAVVRLASGEHYERVSFVDGDSVADLAILKIPGHDLPTLPTRSSLPSPGERVVVIGSPLGLSRTVSEGIISARRIVEGRELVQLTAAISPGSSGGPVLDEQGRAFSVASATLEEGQQLNFAVPVRYALGLLGEARRERSIAEVYAAPPSRVLLRLVRGERKLLSLLKMYVVPRRRFEDFLVTSCAAVGRTLDSLEQEDPDIELGWLRAARLDGLDLALLHVAQRSARDSADVSEEGRVGPVLVPEAAVLIGKFAVGRTYTVAQLSFARGVTGEQRLRISEVRRPVRMCYDGLAP